MLILKADVVSLIVGSDRMNRIKGKYVAQLSIDIDTPYDDQDYRPIAEIKERF